MNNNTEFVKDIVFLLVKNLSDEDETKERNTDIVLDYLNGSTMMVIAHKHNLSLERIRQILWRERRRTIYRLGVEFKQLKRENKELLARNAGLKNENAQLRKMIPEARPKGLKTPVFDLPIEDLDLSVRVYNCLKTARVNTLLELKAFENYELLKFRNMGKKSLMEIVRLMQTYFPEEYIAR